MALILGAGTLLVPVWDLGTGASLDHARSVALTTMVLYQNFSIASCRSGERPFYRQSPLTNPFLFVAIVAALALHVLALYLPVFQFVLHTEPIALDAWLRILPIVATVVLGVEVDKAIRRRRPCAWASSR